MTMEVRPLQDGFAAEVIGARPDMEMDEDAFARVEQAWKDYPLLVFRDLDMSPAQQIAFSRRLGPLHIMSPPQYNLEGYPEIFVVANAEENGKAVGMRRVGLGWHADGEDKKIPNAGSWLYALRIPDEGGDTLFADMYAAYAGLPADVRRTILGRRARFSRIDLHEVHYPAEPSLTEEQKAARPDVLHPLARRHPKTGRTSLFVGRWACDIEGLPKDEGAEIIRFLQSYSVQPDFVYQHRWSVHDAVLWDNRCTQHCATGFDEARYVRHMHRTTLEGEVPEMAAT